MANYSRGAGMLMGHFGGAIGAVDSTINAGCPQGREMVQVKYQGQFQV